MIWKATHNATDVPKVRNYDWHLCVCAKKTVSIEWAMLDENATVNAIKYFAIFPSKGWFFFYLSLSSQPIQHK